LTLPQELRELVRRHQRATRIPRTIAGNP
jgi:hypothetical protein